MQFIPYLIFVILIAVFWGEVNAQHPNHQRYPRIAIQQSWVDPDQDCLIPIFARFNLIVADVSSSQIQRIKAINPNAIILPFDSIIWDSKKDAPVDEWYDELNRPDVSDRCPIYNGNLVVYGVPLNGLNYRDWRAKASLRWRDMGFDGVYLDHWDKPYWGDTSRYTAQEYKDGMSYLASKIREYWPGLVLLGNAGESFEFSYAINGFMWENYPGFSGSLEREFRVLDDWTVRDEIPRIFIMNLRMLNFDEQPNPGEKKPGFWQLMRYATGISLLKDNIYVKFNYGVGGSPHWAIPWWFDEWSVELGLPLGPMYRLSNDVLARKFQQGIVLVNATSSPKTITSNELDDSYFRIAGSQQPLFNNGQQFSQITLEGWSKNDNTQGDWAKPIGDAIILLKNRRQVVSEILIDDEGNNQNPIIINTQGQFQENGMEFDVNKYQRWSNAWRIHGHGSSYFAEPGNGDKTAKWIPRIGTPGTYEIFEWHPTDNSFATNAPYTIHHTGKDTTVIINQTINGGQWNSLGTYYLSAGNANFIELSNLANGVVVADAIRFIYCGGSQQADLIPPNPPQNVQIKNP